MASVVYWLWLSAIKGVSVRTKYRLLEHMGSPEAVFFAEERAFRDLELSEREKKALDDKNLRTAKAIEKACREGKIRVLPFGDEEYPNCLRAISAPPMVLYVKGNLPDMDEEPSIAIVGTRKLTPYGRRITEKLAYELAGAGITVVTGLAEGIDSAAAQAAINAGGKVIGVLGSGVDIVYPAWNRKLFSETELHGALVSEYPPGTRPSRSSFPERNRIISALSHAVLITEAPERSGALITASHALEQGKEIFAVPGNIDAPSAQGTNSLIKDGALPATDTMDILREYSAVYPDKIDIRTFVKMPEAQKEETSQTVPRAAEAAQEPPWLEVQLEELSEDELKVVSAMGAESVHTDELTSSTGLPANRVIAAATLLQIRGYISQLPGGRFKLIATFKK